MRCILCCAAGLCLSTIAVAADLPTSRDPRLEITLFAEQPQIATPTGLDVDSRGRVWAIECNTHFRPADYKGHPSDRVLVFRDADGDGRAEAPTTFADGFEATMSVAVRPAWMPPVVVNPSQAPGKQQVYVATRNRVMLLEDLDGDDVCDRQTALFQLDTRGNYPHNGFAGFAFDPLGAMYVGMGENLGEPYKVRDRNGDVVFESGEGGNLYRFQPDGTKFELFARGTWNPHASGLDAFGHLFTVDNDPDSRPPCRLLHVIEGGNFGYRFSNGRKGLHPFTSWDGQVFGTLPMVAGTGEAPSAVLAYEHAAFPEEYRGDLFVTSWGDHRIDRFRLKPKGASYESIAEPVIVGGEEFRPVGMALAPDGSLYCSDWVKRDYELHGHGRLWRISAKSPAGEAGPIPEPNETDVAKLSRAVESPSLVVRRTAARRLAEINGGALMTIVRNRDLPARPRYEALAALVVHPSHSDFPRVLKSTVPVDKPPFDAVQTLMETRFDDRPSASRIVELLRDPAGSDPNYILSGLEVFIPVLRALANSSSDKVIEVANRDLATNDPFARSRLIRLMSRALDPQQLLAIISASDRLSPELRTCAVLAARAASPGDEAAARAAINRPEPLVRRAAVQWAAEDRLSALRPDVEACLTRTPMTTDLFLATLGALEMLDGKNPQDFDKTPSSQYVVPLVNSDQTPPGVLAIALRLIQPGDAAIPVRRLVDLAGSPDERVVREAVWTLASSTSPDAIEPLLAMADRADVRADVLLGLSRWLQASPPDPRIQEFLTRDEPWTADTLRAVRGSLTSDATLRAGAIKRSASLASQSPEETAELVAQLALALGSEPLPEEVRTRVLPRPQDAAAWRLALLDEHAPAGDAEAGRIVFFHPQGPGCFKCHTVEGRGGKVGPDLSQIGRAFTREKLVDSILDPSREISPQFTTWQMVDADGRVHTGMIVHENEGKTILGDSEAKTEELPTAFIAERKPQRVSVMPEKLVERMTMLEFRDLIAYLQATGP